MKKFILMGIFMPLMAYGALSPMLDIKVQVMHSEEVPGLYLIKWDGTYWAQLEILEYCEAQEPDNEDICMTDVAIVTEDEVIE